MAVQIAGQGGIIVELGSCEDLTSNIWCLDTTPFSKFPQEKEILFFGGNDTLLQINNISKLVDSRSWDIQWDHYGDHIRAIQGVVALATNTQSASKIPRKIHGKVVDMIRWTMSWGEEQRADSFTMSTAYVQKLLGYQMSTMPHHITYEWADLVERALWIQPIVLKNPDQESAEKLLNFETLCFLFPQTSGITVVLPVCDAMVSLENAGNLLNV